MHNILSLHDEIKKNKINYEKDFKYIPCCNSADACNSC